MSLCLFVSQTNLPTYEHATFQLQARPPPPPIYSNNVTEMGYTLRQPVDCGMSTRVLSKCPERMRRKRILVSYLLHINSLCLLLALVQLSTLPPIECFVFVYAIAAAFTQLVGHSQRDACIPNGWTWSRRKCATDKSLENIHFCCHVSFSLPHSIRFARLPLMGFDVSVFFSPTSI